MKRNGELMDSVPRLTVWLKDLQTEVNRLDADPAHTKLEERIGQLEFVMRMRVEGLVSKVELLEEVVYGLPPPTSVSAPDEAQRVVLPPDGKPLNLRASDRRHNDN